MRSQGFTSWSASRLDDYTQCPYFAKLKHLDKLCPQCFVGRLQGKYGETPICSNCHKPKPMSDPLKRGGVIGESLEKFIIGKSKKLHEDVDHPAVLTYAKTLRDEFKQDLVKVEFMLNFDRNFRLIPASLGWTPDIWLIVKMDVWRKLDDSTCHVTDWKTGGVDRDGNIRANEKYDDQLLAYKVASLCANPGMTKATSDLVFIDTRHDLSPVIEREPLPARSLEKAKKKLYKLSLPIMTDRVFAPTPSRRCGYCDFRKTAGGPCQFY